MGQAKQRGTFEQRKELAVKERAIQQIGAAKRLAVLRVAGAE